MIMKIPTSPADNDYYGHGEPPYELDADDLDAANELESSFDDDDFSEYLWMENEEEFDKNEMQRLEEEALMEECMEAMLQDELNDDSELHMDRATDRLESSALCEVLSAMKVKSAVEASTLNPLAEEFVPTLSLVPATS